VFEVTQTEEECLSVLNTVAIKAKLHNLAIDKNEKSFAQYILSEVRNLAKRESLSKSAKNYIFKHLNPAQVQGFSMRWHRFYQTVSLFHNMKKQLADKTDLQRLQLALNMLYERGFAVGFDTPTEMAFEGEDYERMQGKGIVMFPTCVVRQAADGNYNHLISLYYIAQSSESLSDLTYTLQMHGFNIYVGDRPYSLRQLAVLDVFPERLVTAA
jgi:hypothetical protein